MIPVWSEALEIAKPRAEIPLIWGKMSPDPTRIYYRYSFISPM